MTNAAALFSWGLSDFGQHSATSQPSEDAPAILTKADESTSTCPDAYDLIAQHEYWFGGAIENSDANGWGAVHDCAKRTEPEKQAASVSYKMPETPANARADDSMSAARKHVGTAGGAENIAETLANAERLLGKLSNLPTHSRLSASLTALEGALAGTSLSDLEAALVPSAKKGS